MSKLEILIVLKMIEVLEGGCYYFRFAKSEEFEKYLDVEDVKEEFDGLIYRKTVEGKRSNKLVLLYTWSSGISLFRYWIEWL